jgi:cytochrome P450
LRKSVPKLVLATYLDIVLTTLFLPKGRKEVMKLLNKLLDERKKAPQRERVDFLDLLIDILKDEKLAMSENFALNLIFLLLFAGFETTASGITAAVKFLTDNPKALQELTVRNGYFIQVFCLQ